jgi:hypothetical protein
MSRSRIGALAVVAVVVFTAAFAACDGDDATDTASSESSRPTPGCRATHDSSDQRMTVQPCADLVDGQTVKVYAAAFTPGVEVEVTQCSADSKPGGAGCDPDDVAVAEIGDGGSVVVDFAVKKVLASKDPVNCTAARCVLRLGERDGEGEQADPVAVTFAP